MNNRKLVDWLWWQYNWEIKLVTYKSYTLDYDYEYELAHSNTITIMNIDKFHHSITNMIMIMTHSREYE